MTPDDVLSDLQAWIDGELEPERAAEIEAAVAADPELQDRVGELRVVDDLLDLLDEPPVPPASLERIVQRAAAAAQPPWWKRPAPWAAAAAVLVLGLCLRFFVGGGNEGDAGPEVAPDLGDYAVIVPAASDEDPELAEVKAALEMSRFVENNFLPMG